MSDAWVEAQLPHTGPMRWVDSVRLAEDASASHARAFVTEAHPFVVAGKLPRAAMIELLAQGAAAGASLRAAVSGKRVIRGLLVSVRDLHFTGDARVGNLVEIRAWEEHRLPPLVQGRLEAWVDGRLIAHGRMTFHLTFE